MAFSSEGRVASLNCTKVTSGELAVAASIKPEGLASTCQPVSFWCSSPRNVFAVSFACGVVSNNVFIYSEYKPPVNYLSTTLLVSVGTGEACRALFVLKALCFWDRNQSPPKTVPNKKRRTGAGTGTVNCDHRQRGHGFFWLFNRRSDGKPWLRPGELPVVAGGRWEWVGWRAVPERQNHWSVPARRRPASGRKWR